MILVTGASGFVGRHLIAHLIGSRTADSIVAYSSRALSGVRTVEHGDHSAESVRFIDMGVPPITTIIHAGAWIPRSAVDANDAAAASENLRTLRRLLDGQLPEVRRFVLISSVDVYGSVTVVDDSTDPSPETCYAKSKLECEQLAADWCTKRDVDLFVLRLGHTYGPGEEHFRKVIPVTMQRILDGKPVLLSGAGSERRAFLFVDDAARAIDAAIDIAPESKPINVVSRHSVTIREMIDLIIELSGMPVVVEHVDSGRIGRSFECDSSRCRELLIPTELPLRDGILREWDYMKSLAGQGSS